MNDYEYKVQIEQFEGPLDLLLYLINKARIDIEEIFVSKVTGQYLAYISEMGHLSMDKASEFLEMAAMLVYIKSRMLLPTNDVDDDEEEDPEQELISRLKIYKAFKDAANTMKDYESKALRIYYKLPEEVAFPDEKIVFEEMSLEALFEAYSIVLSRIPDSGPEQKIDEVEIHHDIFTIKEQCKFIVRAINQMGSVTFFSLFSGARSKMEVAVTFIALLELIHKNTVIIKQSGSYEDIFISKTSEGLVG